MMRNEGGIWLLQKKYVLDMLMKYGMADCKSISTPLDQNLKLRIDEGEVLDDATMYRRIVDNFIYMTISQPDLSYAVELSAAVTWSSKKQPTLALLSTEAEYRGAIVEACEVAWLEMLLQDLQIQVQDPIVINYDNLSSIQLVQNPVFHACMKHIEVHYHFITERVLDDNIDLAYVGTKDQAAALGAEKLRRFKGMLGLRDMALSLRGSVEI
ncbi:hypothetical protein L7F22_033772 [Adiantum nelumboides]|nr:hypothetical protein [Adiantum nelumboides]